MLIVPIRHHSPAAARQVERIIRERRPGAVLIEGPRDADPLIPLLLDSQTIPPVAIYAYDAAAASPDGDRLARDRARSAFYPFCDYSPEYAALRAGRAAGAELRFIDVPASATLAAPEPAIETSIDAPDGPRGGYAAFTRRLAAAAGFEAFEAFWESAYEQGGGRATQDEFLAIFGDFGEKARAFIASRHDEAWDDLRERHMAASALEVAAAGIDPAAIVIVCGAAHAAALGALIDAGTTMPDLPPPATAELTLVPYSFPRLSEQLGYGAGNRAPWFYQQVWGHDGDYVAASRRALLALAAGLRRRGHLASIAQGIDADDLAATLAALRGKPAPGVDEIVDAATACFGQGQPAAVTAVLQDVLVGDALGRVTPWAGRTPLQTEFYATAQRLNLPVIDATRQILVHLPVPNEAAQSTFLHRLTAAAIPFAHELQSGIGGGGRAARGGALAGLGRALEKWELCWTPATDAALVERNVEGSSLAEVCRRLLQRRLDAARRIDEGTEILLRLALCDLPEPFPAAMARCESLAADSASFPALARAAFHLDGLLAYGATRRLPVEHLSALAARLFSRAMLHLAAAADCADEAADEAAATLTPLADLVRNGSAAAAPDLFWEAIASLASNERAHPALRGLALTLLETGGRLAGGELARRLRLLLTGGDAAANARAIAGLFSLHRGALIRNRGLIAAVTDFLLTLDFDQLIPLLPSLRRSLGDLSAAEQAYLAETLGGVLGMTARVPIALSVSDLERAALTEADAAAAATLAEWKTRYGIG